MKLLEAMEASPVRAASHLVGDIEHVVRMERPARHPDDASLFRLWSKTPGRRAVVSQPWSLNYLDRFLKKFWDIEPDSIGWQPVPTFKKVQDL